MSNLYNTVLGSYSQNFDSLSRRAQFHFASRLYLWEQISQATEWLATLRPWFTANGNPRAALQQLLLEPLPTLRETTNLRQPYFNLYPKLQPYTRALFRLLFLCSVYKIDKPDLIFELFSREELLSQRNALLKDYDALKNLSSFAINFLYLLERFINRESSSLPVHDFLKLGREAYDTNKPLERQLQCYLFTHCVIAESLFYYRRVPEANRGTYMEMLRQTEDIIDSFFSEIKLDNKLEFLVCCRLLGYQSQLESTIMESAEKSLTRQGFIHDQLSRSKPSLQAAEHRNVLFLMSQQPFRPLA